MIVVADSSPLQYLILLEQTPLLEHFYRQVIVPEAVAAELRAPGAPEAVRGWMTSRPSWINVVQVTAEETAPIADWLDAGERAAIALAERLHADVLLIDEKDGRAEALRRSFHVTGTLGILFAAAQQGLVDVIDVLARLRQTTFYADQALIERQFGKWLSRE
jgi:predicted nucleic acid-binding protein